MKKIFAEFILGICILFLLSVIAAEAGIQVYFIKSFIIFIVIFVAKEAFKRL